MKKRIFNNRPICFTALFLAMGLVIGEALYPFNKLYRLIPAVLSLIGAIGLFSFPKTRKFGYMAVSFLVGLVAICGANDVYDSRRIPNLNTTIQATVDSEIVIENGNTAFYVKDIVIDGNNLDGRGYVYVRGDDYPAYRAGDIVNIYGDVSFNEHIPFDSFYAVSVNKSSYYNIWANGVYKVADGKPSFPLNLQLNIKQMFYENMDGDSAMICSALILGDKFGIDDSLYDGIKASGLAHVLAVSGLHVTALASAILALLKKTRLKPILSLSIVGVLTLFYVMMCGFTSSSIRAFIMTMVLNFGGIMGYKYDKLNSLSLASIIILLTKPQAIMDVGFLLSVFSVLGIFIYYRTFRDWGEVIISKVGLGKRKKENGGFLYALDRGTTKCVRGVFESASVSVSATLMTLPFIGYFFGELPVLFVVSNIIMLPNIMFIFIFLLIITLFCQITTLWGGVTIMQFLLLPLRSWAGFIGSLSWANIELSVSVFFIIGWIVGAIISSKYIFVNRKVKIASLSLWLAMFVTIVILCLVF